MHFVYILYSPSADRYYVGQTPDMEKRMVWHNELGDGYTSKYRPWVLRKSVKVDNITTALKVERYIKKKKSRAFVERLVKENDLWAYVLDKWSAG